MTNRRDFLVKFTMAASASSFLKPLHVFAGVGANMPNQTGNTVLTILHTANLKGQWSSLGMDEKLGGLGGLKNITKKIDDIRNQNHEVLVIDAGNMSGHHQTKEERLHFFDKLSKAGYDAVIPGRTDLTYGKTCFTELIKETNLNTVSSTGQLTTGSVLPYSLFKKGKTRIGIINAGTAALKNAHISGLHPEVVMNQTAHLLRSSKNCTIIICVVQSTAGKCSKLAGLSDGIDVMVSAAENNSIHNTQIVRNRSDHEIIVSYAGPKGSMMSRIDFTFNDKREKINVASKAIFAGAESETYAVIVKKCAMYNS